MSPAAAARALGQGNPGAINVCLALATTASGEESIRQLTDLGFRGSDIWVAFKDFAGQDLAKLQAALATKDPAMVAAVELERAL